MRRSLILFFLVTLSLLSACSANDNNNDVTINEAKLSDFERSMMGLIGEFTSVFDVTIKNDSAELIEISIDAYENGEKREEILNFNSYLEGIDLSKPVRVLFSKRMYENEGRWLAAVLSDGGIASNETEIKSGKQFSGTAFGMVSMPNSFKLGEKKVVGTIASTDEESVHIRSEIENEEDLQEAVDYEQVYIISVSVK